jgi:acetyl esterase
MQPDASSKPMTLDDLELAAPTRAIVERMAAWRGTASPPLDISRFRHGLSYLGQLMGPPEDVASVNDLRARGREGDIPVRIVWPAARPGDRAPLIVYLHGGGWIGGDIESADAFCRALANRSGAPVASIGYRVAPEHRYPAAFDDCVDAVAWLVAAAPALGVDGARVVLVGDSAGATLVAATAAHYADRGNSPVAMQVLLYPPMDPRAESETHRRYGDMSLALRTEDMRWFWQTYAGDRPITSWQFAPAEYPHLDRLPATILVTAEFDPLRSEAEDFAARLWAAGVPVVSVCARKTIHGFLWMSGELPEARHGLEVLVALIREQLVLQRHLHDR